MKKKVHSIHLALLSILLMLLFAALFLMPVYVMLVSSLKTFAEVQRPLENVGLAFRI